MPTRYLPALFTTTILEIPLSETARAFYTGWTAAEGLPLGAVWITVEVLRRDQSLILRPALYTSFPQIMAALAAVVQLTTAFASGDTGTPMTIGTATSSATKQYNGAFDHDYITAATPTGNLYVCGDPGGDPTIYQIPIDNGTNVAAKAGPVISTTTKTQCSPVTDVYNAVLHGAGLPQEWVFTSVQGAGTPNACGGHSCVMNFKVTSWQPNTVYNTGQEILDSNLSVEVAENPLGTSGATAPIWNSATFSPTDDGGVHWRSQGPLSAQTAWILGRRYLLRRWPSDYRHKQQY